MAAGPLAGGLLAALRELDRGQRPELWVLAELPLAANPVPEEFFAALERAGRLCVVEEHVASGGIGQMLAHLLLVRGVHLSFEHVCALGYPSSTYGSQGFHRKECGLDPESLRNRILQMPARP